MDISVIIPSFNDKRIIRTVNSILAQDLPRENYEVIVMDGGSSRESFGGVLEYLSQVCDVVVSEPDHGIFDGLNKGIDIARGDLLFMVGSDDYLIRKNVFSEALDIHRSQSANLIAFELFYVNSKDRIERHWTLPNNRSRIPSYFQFPHFSTFMARDFVGPLRFEIDADISADFIFFKGLLECEPITYFVKSPSVCMTSGGQSSKNLKNIIKGNLQSLSSLNSDLRLIIGFLISKLRSKFIHFVWFRLFVGRRNASQALIDDFLVAIGD